MSFLDDCLEYKKRFDPNYSDELEIINNSEVNLEIVDDLSNKKIVEESKENEIQEILVSRDFYLALKNIDKIKVHRVGLNKFKIAHDPQLRGYSIMGPNIPEIDKYLYSLIGIKLK